MKKQLEYSFQRLLEVTGLPYSYESAANAGANTYLRLDNNPTLGGWKLAEVDITSRTEYGAFGYSSIAPRLSAKEMDIQIQGILAGIKFANNKK